MPGTGSCPAPAPHALPPSTLASNTRGPRPMAYSCPVPLVELVAPPMAAGT
jgi:hypothetical protein